LINIHEKCTDRRVVEHNKKAYEAISKNAEAFYQTGIKDWPGIIPEDIATTYKEQTMWFYHFDADTSIVSFMDTSVDGVRTNAIHISESSSIPSLKSLIDEANEWYEKLDGFSESFIHNVAIIKR
jgi:hypothetical protein